MPAQNERISAKVYLFPARGRFANPNGVAKTESPLPTASIGGAWYHDETMKEEQKAQKH